MRVLVTGGAGFIGSHTCDRLLAHGHDVVVLDALTPPVHPYGTTAVPQPRRRLLRGRRPQPRTCHQPAAAASTRSYHFAAYQDYLPEFSRFSDVNVVSTALLYEIIVAERLDLAARRGRVIAGGDG